MTDIEHPLRDGPSSQAMEPQASPPKASIPDASIAAQLLPATDDDRKASAALYLKTVGEPNSLHDQATAAEIEMGLHDDWDCVQAFAAHRHAILWDPTQNMAGGLWYRRWFKIANGG